MPISLSSELESQLPPIPPCDLGKFSHRILAFKRYLLSICYVPGTVLSEAVIIPALLNLIVSLEKKASSNLSFKQLWTHSSDYSGEVLSGSEAFSEDLLRIYSHLFSSLPSCLYNRSLSNKARGASASGSQFGNWGDHNKFSSDCHDFRRWIFNSQWVELSDLVNMKQVENRMFS